MSNNAQINQALANALWQLYHRSEKPQLWEKGGNLPWSDPDFSQRMLQEHLDKSHGAASRAPYERTWQVKWLWEKLALQPGHKLLDLTCGPGLYAVDFAKRGCSVLGIDFAPAAIDYARHWAATNKVTDRCQFVQQDVLDWVADGSLYDAALFLYGQLAVFPPEKAQQLLHKTAASLRPGGKLCVELLDPELADKQRGNWWFTDHQGLWGNSPFLHLGERFWDEASQTTTDRFIIIHLETGETEEITLCDQLYAPAQMEKMMHQAGLEQVQLFPGWDGGPLYDAPEWLVYVATKAERSE